MKKLLLASTALVASAGIAAADVTLSGDGRMGIVYDESVDTTEENELAFTSRARVTFTLSGQTDAGLAFGGSFRADNAGTNGTAGNGAVNGQAGSVFISGDFGRITMGDTNGAAQFVVGNIAGVGLTGLGDLNDNTYLGNPGGQRPIARYDINVSGFTFAASHTNPGSAAADVFALGVGYSTDMFSVGLGYEKVSGGADHVIVGASGTFEGVTVRADYGTLSGAANDQYGVSVSGSFDAVSATAFYQRDFDGGNNYGLGASYSLGGGASFVAGIVRDGGSNLRADAGLSFSF